MAETPFRWVKPSRQLVSCLGCIQIPGGSTQGPQEQHSPSPSSPVLPCPSQCGGFQPALSVLIFSRVISPPHPAKVTPPSPNSVYQDGLSHLAAQDSNSPSPASSPHPSQSSACTDTDTVTANVCTIFGEGWDVPGLTIQLGKSKAGKQQLAKCGLVPAQIL